MGAQSENENRFAREYDSMLYFKGKTSACQVWVRPEEHPRTSYPDTGNGVDRDREAGGGTAGTHEVSGRAKM